MTIATLWNLLKIGDTIDADVTQGEIMNASTPAWKTAAFWLHVFAQVPTVVAYFLGASNPIVLAVGAAAGLSSVIYNLAQAHVSAIASVTTAVNASTAALTALAAANPPAPAAAAPSAPAPAAPAPAVAAPAAAAPAAGAAPAAAQGGVNGNA